MKKILLSLLAFPSVALLGGCVSMDAYNDLAKHLETEEQANAALAADNERINADNAKLNSDNNSLREKIKGMADVSNASKMTEEEMLAKLRGIWGTDGKDDRFEWIRNGEAVGVRFDDSAMLFNSGSWVLTAGTKDKLTKLADIMKKKLDTNDAVVRIDGHTDTDPIKSLSKQGVKDNVDLSVRRAQAVREFLIERGIAKDRIFVAGFGEYWPCEDGKDAKAKQRNRRVEIFMGTSEGLSIGKLPTAQVSK